MSESDRVQKFLAKFIEIQESFLNYLENEENLESNFQNLNQLLEDSKIRDCKHDVRLFFHFLVKVADNHHRCPNFFSKIERILLLFKEYLTKHMKEEEIFLLFQSNKRLLLFLIEEKILKVDQRFVKQIINKKYLEKKYPQYFAPEIEPFLNEKWFPKYDPNDEKLQKNKWIEDIKKKLPDDFYEMRKIGQNESYICQLIREDSVEKFIVYVNKNGIDRHSEITPSIYETNSFLIKKQTQPNEDISLIEYAVFFGSNQIFTFLKNERVDVTPSLLLEAIHGQNAELIHLIEPEVTKEDNQEMFYKECFSESIKCHHNAIANYFLNFLQRKDEDSNILSLKYYNFSFLQEEELINESSFFHICSYDYYYLAENLLASRDVDINRKEIQNHIIQWNSKSYHSITFKIISFNRIQNHIFQ